MIGDVKIDSGTIMSIDIAHGKKRKIPETAGGDSDEENMFGQTVAPPVHDIYRVRQQKKAR